MKTEVLTNSHYQICHFNGDNERQIYSNRIHAYIAILKVT